MSNVNKDIFDMIHYLKEYTFEYTFNEEELKKYGFLENPEIQWPAKPIVFASDNNVNRWNVMAFGGCIGLISFENRKLYFSQEEEKEVKTFAKYLSPK